MKDEFAKSKMLVVYDHPKGATQTYDDTCNVEFNGNKIKITFREYGELKTWLGNCNDNDGHYEIVDAENIVHYGSMHKSSKSKIMIGRWHENLVRGFWEITLIK